MKKTTIETEEQKKNRETIEGIAYNIQKLADAVASLLNGPLKKKALVVLLAKSSGLHLNQVESVLTAMENLSKDWLNK